MAVKINGTTVLNDSKNFTSDTVFFDTDEGTLISFNGTDWA